MYVPRELQHLGPADIYLCRILDRVILHESTIYEYVVPLASKSDFSTFSHKG